MALLNVYVCDRCDHEVQQNEMPVVYVINCGVVREGALVDTQEDPTLTEFERGLMQKPISRIELDPTCMRQLIRPTAAALEAQLVQAGIDPEVAGQVAAIAGIPDGFLSDLFDESR